MTLTQNAAEFWNVCTRPRSARGGCGLSVEETAGRLRLIERLIQIRPDSEAIFREWKRVIVAHSVRGVQVHDARLAFSSLLKRRLIGVTGVAEAVLEVP